MSTSRTTLSISSVMLVVFLTGCGWTGSFNNYESPFGSEESGQDKPKPLVMPGEQQDSETTQTQSSDNNKRINPGARTTSVASNTQDQSTSETSQQISPSPESEQNPQQSSSDSTRLIEPSFVNPEQARRIAGEAHTAYENGNVREAIRKYKKARQLDPTTVEYTLNLGSLHFSEENYSQAIQYYREVLNDNPDHLQANLYAGGTYIRLNKPKKARKHLRKVLKMDPQNRQARALMQQVN